MKKRKYRGKYRTAAERKAAMKAYQKAYCQAKKDGTWRPKKEIGKERVIDLLKGVRPVEDPLASAREHVAELGIGIETGLKGLKDMTPAERTAAKSAYQRKYRELKRLAAGRPKRKHQKHKMAVSERKPCGRKSKFSTEAERLEAKREYNRRYHLMRKQGGWKRKNRIFSERIAKKVGVQTVSSEIRSKMVVAPVVVYDSVEDWSKRRAAHIAELRARKEERRQYTLKKYGFDLTKKPAKDASPEELAAREEWRKELGRLEYLRKREKMRAYNKCYRQRQRAKALAEAQKSWTAEEWIAWNTKQEKKRYGEGTDAYIINGVVKLLAEQGGVSEDAITEKLLTEGGIDFITRGIEAFKAIRSMKPSILIQTAARAVAFFLDPDSAVMFPKVLADGQNSE